MTETDASPPPPEAEAITVEKPAPKPSRGNLAVMCLFGATAVLGVLIALAGYLGLENNGLALVGGLIATGAVLLMLAFQLFGRDS